MSEDEIKQNLNGIREAWKGASTCCLSFVVVILVTLLTGITKLKYKQNTTVLCRYASRYCDAFGLHIRATKTTVCYSDRVDGCPLPSWPYAHRRVDSRGCCGNHNMANHRSSGTSSQALAPRTQRSKGLTASVRMECHWLAVISHAPGPSLKKKESHSPHIECSVKFSLYGHILPASIRPSGSCCILRARAAPLFHTYT